MYTHILSQHTPCHCPALHGDTCCLPRSVRICCFRSRPSWPRRRLLVSRVQSSCTASKRRPRHCERRRRGQARPGYVYAVLSFRARYTYTYFGFACLCHRPRAPAARGVAAQRKRRRSGTQEPRAQVRNRARAQQTGLINDLFMFKHIYVFWISIKTLKTPLVCCSPATRRRGFQAASDRGGSEGPGHGVGKTGKLINYAS